MSKLCLIMDDPKICADCIVHGIHDGKDIYCRQNYKISNEIGIRPKWCPLIKLPDDIDSEKVLKLFYKLYDEIVEDGNYGKSKQATLKLIADGIEVLNILGMDEE